MKIYERIVLDWDGGVVEEDCFDYEGPVSWAGGGGGGKSKPKVQPAPPAPEPTKEAAKEAETSAAAGTNDAKRKAQMAAGLSGTNVTGGAMAAGAATQKKSLMGQ